MNNKINYEIDNCTTDLDTLIALDKRAIRDLENNTHEIEQHEVLTIIREFIRLRNDYKQEKEKNKDLQKQLNGAFDRGFISKDKIKEKYLEMEQEYARKVYDNNYNRTEVKKEEMYKRQVYEDLLEEV